MSLWRRLFGRAAAAASLTVKSPPDDVFAALRAGRTPDEPVPEVDWHGRPLPHDTWPLFLVAMQHVDDVPTLDTLLALGPDLRSANPYGETALHIAAARCGSTAVIDRLIDAGIPIDARAQATFTARADGVPDAPWRTPLYCALGNPDPRIVPHLLAHGADPDAANPNGYTPAMVCAERPERVAALRALAVAGADFRRAAHNGLTPLIVACSHDNLPAAAWLLDAVGPDPQRAEDEGSAAEAAASHASLPLLELFDAHVNWRQRLADDRTYLMLAAGAGAGIEKLRWLAARCDVAARDVDGLDAHAHGVRAGCPPEALALLR